ncbi:DNA mismatch repair protein MutS [Muribaculaceae bacterium]|nr:DNA mismatch repair protein MutS [Muribaculaceae bacterium]
MSGSGNPLDMLLDFVRMGFHLDLIKFNQMLSETRKHISDIDNMITIIGKIEAMIAIGEYRASLEEYCIPEFVGKTGLNAEELYHPLINEPVKNTIYTSSGILITGSNASGKSTFLKTVAINSLFAQTIHTCLAKRYETALFRMVSSMSLKDDVQSGDSYYMAEIKSIKRILDLTLSEGIPVLCFVDEVLRGTNTVERIAASTQILKSLCRNNCICFAATHDIELTHLLEGIFDNYHFTEKIEENDISFTYKIPPAGSHVIGL